MNKKTKPITRKAWAIVRKSDDEIWAIRKTQIEAIAYFAHGLPSDNARSYFYRIPVTITGPFRGQKKD